MPAGSYIGNIAPGTSAEALAMRRKLAEQMLQPMGQIKHWTQGLQGITEGLVGGYLSNQADEGDVKRQRQTQEMLTGLFGLGDESAEMPSAQPASYAPTDIRPPSMGGGSSPMETYAGAISGIESGGDYAKLGPVTPKGDRAYGKYQVMGSNVGPWTKEVLGKEMTAEDFLANPQAQDAVFNAKFGQYADRYGPEGAARAWFAGEGGMNDMGRKDQLGTTVDSYAKKFNRGIRRGRREGAPAAAAPTLASSEKRRLRQAIAMISNPDTAALGNKILLDHLTKTGTDTSGIKEYQLAQSQGYEGSFLDFQKDLQGTGKPTSGMQEYELAKSQGFEGSFIEFQSAIAGGKTGAQTTAKTQAEASAVIPAAETTVNNALATVNDLRKHPGLDRATGISNWADPRNFVPGTVGADFLARNETAQAQAFMTAREGLKGAGQVTDFEGGKGERAIANLTAAQSKEQYLKALDDLERMMKASLEDLKRKSGTVRQPQPAPQGGAPGIGQTIDASQLQGLPDNTIIEDDAGNRFKVMGGRAVPVQ